MSDFSDRPLFIEAFVGMRAFSVDKYGRLIAPSQKTVFTPGENVAECRSSAQLMSGIPEGSHIDYESSYRFGYGGMVGGYYTVVLPDGSTRIFASPQEIAAVYPPKDDDPHLAASSLSCGCGFYAYFDGSNTYAQSDRVTALIEGYGVCTVGDKGFRAEKARLVALVEPKHLRIPPKAEEPNERRPHLLRRILASPWTLWSIVGLQLVIAVSQAVEGNYIYAGISLTWAICLSIQQTLNDATRRERKRTDAWQSAMNVSVTFNAYGESELSREQWNKVRAAYPDVPIYNSVKAALAAHPLTKPAEPTPDDPEFWTRSAS